MWIEVLPLLYGLFGLPLAQQRDMAGKHLKIGVFVPDAVQLLDLSPIDLFGMTTPWYLQACGLPESMVRLGVENTIHYIGMKDVGEFVNLTASASLKVTRRIGDVDVEPGKLDILLIPGPDPSAVFGDDVKAFVKSHVDWAGGKGEKTDVLSVCTGINVLAQAGVLDGRKASGPRALLPVLQKKYPKTDWVEDKRWAVDGTIWTSGGITNGQEMVAAYLREKFPGPLAEAVCAMADVGEKGLEYSTGKVRSNVWFLWLIIRSVFVGKKEKSA
ncbi:PfpI endopeptidase-like protein [Bisporella sp. PMI_857]|nr:PfpI endopeptidase-like protein [Bisporella sp. PMI_857]